MYIFSRGKTLLLGFLTVLLLLQAACASELTLAPVNPTFLSYREGKPGAGFGQSPVDWSFLRGSRVEGEWFQTLGSTSNALRKSSKALPPSYDLRVEKRVPPIRNQRSWGTCWAFSGIEAIESSILSETGTLQNLSELHLAYFTYSFEGQDKPGFTRSNKNPNENPIFDNGGFPEQIIAMLSRGTGPVYESDAPYPVWLDNTDGYTWANYIPPAPYAPTRFRLKNAFVFHNAEEVKRALIDVGGLSFAFQSDSGKYLYNRSNFYNSEGDAEPDHAVLLVGWDDNYPKINFRSATGKTPSRDGAWKIQNSWGAEHGDDGYFWISYEDTSIFQNERFQNGALAFKMEPAETHDGIYFHDPLGVSGVISLGTPEARMCNTFVAKRNEKITSVGFFTGNVNIDYEIQIYKNIPGAAGPETGKPALATPQKGRTGPQGYYSVSLNEPIPLNSGERFAVEVKLIADGNTYPSNKAMVPVEMMVFGFSDNVVVSPNESYLYMDGAWKDTYNILLDAKNFDDYSERNFNLNIKAFTTAGNDQTQSSSGGCNTGAFALAFLPIAFVVIRRRI